MKETFNKLFFRDDVPFAHSPQHGLFPPFHDSFPGHHSHCHPQPPCNCHQDDHCHPQPPCNCNPQPPCDCQPEHFVSRKFNFFPERIRDNCFEKTVEAKFFIPGYCCLTDCWVKHNGVDKVCRNGCWYAFIRYTICIQYLDHRGRNCFAKREGCLIIGKMDAPPGGCVTFCIDSAEICAVNKTPDCVELCACFKLCKR